MSIKIGFTFTDKQDEQKTVESIPVNNHQIPNAKKSVVDVYFPDRHLTCSYYNDMFDLKRGDIVYVDGKLEGLRGRVVEINCNFKIKLSDYKRVIGIADTNVKGEFHLAGSHFITTDENALKYEQIISWFKAPEPQDEEFVSSNDDESFELNDLSGMKISSSTADRGHEYYLQNKVQYIELNNGIGRAIVTGTKPYEIEIYYFDGLISHLTCNCYCTGACKHEFATMLQLRDILDIIKKEYPSIDSNDYFAAVSKSTFFEFVIDGNTKGSFTIG